MKVPKNNNTNKAEFLDFGDLVDSRRSLKMAALIMKAQLLIIKRQSICGVNVAVQVCNVSQNPKIIKNPTTANLKRGTGGRCSFNGIVCTVFGSSGFFGPYVVNRLGKIGTQMILPQRGDSYYRNRLKVSGDLGQIIFQPFDLRDEDSIVNCIKYSNVVINLIGRYWETKNFSFDDVNVEGAATLARICKQHGVERFIHVSALNVNPKPKPLLLKEGSQFLRSKYKGECAVKEEFPEATIIRPSDVYALADRFTTTLLKRWRMHFGSIPLYKRGTETEKQPVYVGDVAAGIVAAVLNPDSAGKTYQFVGPERFLLSDLVDWFHDLLWVIENPYYRRYDIRKSPLYKLKISLNELLSPGPPIAYLHWEGLELESTSDNVIKGLPTLEDLGITPVTVSQRIPYEIEYWNFFGYYILSYEEKMSKKPPKPINKPMI